jgi:ribosomal subunit interface protein
MDPSPAVEERVREKAAELEKFFDRIISCHVVIETPPAHKRKGGSYTATIEMRVPGNEPIVVGRHHANRPSHEDVYVAVRDAFEAAKRRLHDYAEKRRDVHAAEARRLASEQS